MHLDLSDMTVLITGASRGIGQAIARHMAEAGAKVAAQYYRHPASVDALRGEFPDRVVGFQADLAQPRDCIHLFRTAVDRFGRVDVLVNNAGIAVRMPDDVAVRMPDNVSTRNPEDGTLEQWSNAWDLTMHVNLRAPELLCRLAIEQFRNQGGGRIINIASRAAFRGDTVVYMTYAASKAGLVALTRSIARNCGKDGIRAFVVAPGFVRTDMAQPFIDEYGEDRVLDGVATDRLTEPDDVAPTVVFLASGRADHATGSTIDINAASYVR